MGRSLWVDNISRETIVKGTLARYVAQWSVTGLTSNTTVDTIPEKTPAAFAEHGTVGAAFAARGKRCSRASRRRACA